MAKYYGSIGFGVTTETVPGVWEPGIVDRKYRGEINRVVHRHSKGEGLNDDLELSMEISIVADPFAYENLQNIRYATWMKSKWSVSSVDVQYPRLTLTLGGVYTENET